MDWIQEWKTRHEKMPYYEDLHKDYELSFWTEFAGYYDELHCRSLSVGLADLLEPYLKGCDSILEIGAGTGALTMELADKVSKVTALDASRPMLEQLERKIRRQGLTNIFPVCSPWEDAEVEQHDLVLASGCTYGFYDIEKAVDKMCSSARKAAAFTGDLNRREPERLTEIRKKFQWEIRDGRDQPYLYNVLYQMGLYPDVLVVRNLEQTVEFKSMSDAVQRLRIMLRLEKGKVSELAEELAPFTDADTGKIVLGESTFNGMLMFCPLT